MVTKQNYMTKLSYAMYGIHEHLYLHYMGIFIYSIYNQEIKILIMIGLLIIFIINVQIKYCRPTNDTSIFINRF